MKPRTSMGHRTNSSLCDGFMVFSVIHMAPAGPVMTKQGFDSDRVYMLKHNRAMNISNKDWIHVNRFIRSASPKGLSQDRISKVDTIAGLKPVIVVYLPACVLNRIVLPGVCILRMLENFSRGFHPEVEGDDVITVLLYAKYM